MIAKYYTRITLKRLTQLLRLPEKVRARGGNCISVTTAAHTKCAALPVLGAAAAPQEAEAFLSRLIVDKTVYGRIDRPAGVVDFRPPQDPVGQLNQWRGSIDTLLGLIERTTHMIAKEEMVHGNAIAAATATAS